MSAESECRERQQEISNLKSRAALARRLMGAVTNLEDRRVLREYAEELEVEAAKLERFGR